VLAARLAGARGRAAARGGRHLRLAGLERPVEVLRDAWGVAHIYAATEHDLFFAQGYTAARDRTFQFELWRRRPPAPSPSCSARARSRATWARGSSGTAGA
jgi:penicillin amidase